MNKNKNYLLLVFALFSIVITLKLCYVNTKNVEVKANISQQFAENKNTSKEYIYLSDIPYDEDKTSFESSHSVLLDKNEDSGIITLIVNQEKTPFLKGICAWATSQVVYNLSDYDYDYFTSYLGVDVSEQSNYFNTGVKFYIYTSDDASDWNLQYQTDTLYGWSEAVFVKINIKNANYLKLVADDNSNSWWANWYDESVYANAKLINEDYVEDNSTFDFIKPVSYYDEIIKENYQNGQIGSEYELTLLQREFVNNVGYDILQAFARCNEDYKDTLIWLMNSSENLSYYLVGGKPDGSYYTSLIQLSRLYKTYGQDMEDTTATEYGNTTRGDLYKRMIISLSLTHSATCGFWAGGQNTTVNGSDALKRYAIYKNMYLNNKLDNRFFERNSVEEMRWVMNSIIDDESIEWLHDWTVNWADEHPTSNMALNPYTYVNYQSYDYSLEKYYSEENYEMWNKKYNLSKYNITYGTNVKTWIVFEEGGVCGAISKVGTTIRNSYGVPASVISQPGHAAYIVQEITSDGQRWWSLWNDVSGWAQSGRTEKLSIRMICEWGSKSDTQSKYSYEDTYIFLAQEALNDFESYEKAEKILMLSNVYEDDVEKLEEIYESALQAESINFEAMLKLAKLYVSEGYPEQKCLELAERVSNTYKYHPLPMYDILNILEPMITSTEGQIKLDMIRSNALMTAKSATANDSLQYQGVKVIASALLNEEDLNVATFSFDGDNAGKIILADRFQGNGVRWEYRLDGKSEEDGWIQVNGDETQLSQEELNSITAENDIRVHIVGTDYDDNNIFVIDITQASAPTGLYRNDLEGRAMGYTKDMEWQVKGTDKWTSFADEDRRFGVDKYEEVYIRRKASGTQLTSSYATYRFWADLKDVGTYIYIENISVYDFSSENGNNKAENANNGLTSIWETTEDDTQRTITYKLNRPMYISGGWYLPRQNNSSGRIKTMNAYTSMDGNTWELVKEGITLTDSNDYQRFSFDNITKAKYVKYEVTQTWSGNTASAAMLSVCYDESIEVLADAKIEYSIDSLTNQDVVATITGQNCELKILNNDGNNSYTFKENGSFTFEFEDEYGNKGTLEANVNWIDKTLPVAKVTYSTTDPTNKEVVATISFNKEVNFINNLLNKDENGNYTYTFTENDNIELEFEDAVGNIGKLNMEVTWIDKEIPTAIINYSTTEETTSSVVATINSEEDITVINNNGKKSYTFTRNGTFEFKFMDKAGNTNSVIAKVDWIKEAIDDENYLKGDLDRNGVVNANDAAIALDLYKYGNVTSLDLKIGDMDDNGIINANDAAIILDIYKYGK